MYIGLHVKYPILLSDFNEIWVFSTDFQKIFKYSFSWNPFSESQVPCAPTDGRTDMTQLIVAFNNFANAPKIEAWIEKQKKRAKLRQGPLKRSLIWKRSAINFPVSPHNKQHRPGPWADVLQMTAGQGHSHRRAFSYKRSFVTRVDNATLISEIYYCKKFWMKRRPCLGLYIHPVTGLRVSRPRNRGSIFNMGKEFVSHLNCADRPLGLLSLLFVGYRGPLPRG